MNNNKEEVHKLKKVQIPLTIPQQIENLKELGLTIEDEDSATEYQISFCLRMVRWYI